MVTLCFHECIESVVATGDGEVSDATPVAVPTNSAMPTAI
jgi:hypothetical protein